MRISLSIAGGPAGEVLSARRLARYGARAEELGFHAIYLTDHFLHRGPTLHSGSAVAVLAAATERIRLGFAAYVLPMRHPLAAAKELAMLDELCEGRLIAGVAAGSQQPEFDALGIPFAERGPRLEEGIAAVTALWTETDATFRGRFYAFAGVRLEPKPVQRPHPPIWIGSWTGAPRAARRVARLAAGWQGSGLFTSLDEARAAIASLDAACRAIGRDPASLGRAFMNVVTAVASRRERAWDALPAGLRAHPDRRLVGTPDEITARLGAMAEAGIEEVGLLLPSWSEGELELLSRDVMPAFR